MSGSSKKPEGRSLVVLIPKSPTEDVAVSIIGTADAWVAEIRAVRKSPDGGMALQPERFLLDPSALRSVAAALHGIANEAGLPMAEWPTAEQLQADIEAAPDHLKKLMLAVGTGRMSYLMAAGRHLPFLAVTEGPAVLLVDDAPARGPDDFDQTLLRKALRRSGLVVVAVEWRIIADYDRAGEVGLEGVSSVIVETRQSQASAWLDFVRREAPDAEIRTVAVEAQADGGRARN